MVFLGGSSPISRVLSCLQADVNDHLSSPTIARRIKRVKRPTDGPSFDVDLLAADRVYLLRASPRVAVSSYLTPFTLTPHLILRSFDIVASQRIEE